MASGLDQLIAQSKQVTEDLMAARRTVKAMASSRTHEEDRRRLADRLYLVLNEIDALRDGASDAWKSAAGIGEEKLDRVRRVGKLLDNGQLKLIAGDR